ncbi:MAG TPA: threonine-phosphate decarboxylase [Desulfobacterales bacterium]|nr:threonine-phosphate decarboxylase [Desulfobacterales bacterium]
MNSSESERPWHGGDLNLARIRFGHQQLIDFSANMNPLGPPPSVWRALTEHLPDIVHYPDPYARELCQALAEHLNISPANLILGNGSVELIYLLPRLASFKRAALPAPGFSEYDYAVRLTSTQCTYLYQTPPDYSWDLDRLKTAVAEGGLIFLCNPNNPTGALLSRDALNDLLEVLPSSALLIMDEAFIDFVDRAEEITLIPQAIKDPRLLVLGSLTKFFSLPGLRLGYLVGSPDLINRLASLLPPWNINMLAQVAGVASLQDKEFIVRSRTFMTQTRQQLYELLADIPGLNPLPPTANFIFCHLSPELPNAPKVVELMGQRGFLLRDCSNYRGLDDHCLRLAVRRQEDNLAMAAALREVMARGM